MKSPQLGPLFENSSVSVLPLTIKELQNAIEAPSRLPDVGLTFDRSLVAEIVFSLRDNDKARTGALPLLQFTLDRLYRERDGTHISFDAYTRLGGVQGAVGNHCEHVFSQLPADVQSKLSHVFLPLISIDEDTGEATRRRVALDKMRSDKQLIAFVKAFVDNRLLQTGLDGKNAYLEIAHEALFRSWTRLSDWIDKTRKDLLLLREVQRDAYQWYDQRKPEHLLWSHERLKHVYDMQHNLSVELNEYEREFITPEADRLLAVFIALVDGDARRGIWRQLNIVDRFTKIGIDAVPAMLVARQVRYSTATTVPKEITATINSFEVSDLIPVFNDILHNGDFKLKQLAINYLEQSDLLSKIDHPLAQKRSEELKRAQEERTKESLLNTRARREQLEREKRVTERREREKREKEKHQRSAALGNTTYKEIEANRRSRNRSKADDFIRSFRNLYTLKDDQNQIENYNMARHQFVILWESVTELNPEAQNMLADSFADIFKVTDYDPWILSFLYANSNNNQKIAIFHLIDKVKSTNFILVLLEMQKDKYWKVRWYATKQLGRYTHDKRAVKGLQDATNDLHNDVRFMANYAIKGR